MAAVRLLGLFRFIVITLLNCLLYSNAYAESKSLSIWLDNQLLTLEIEQHSPLGNGQASDAIHYKGTVAGVANSWVRLSHISQQWEGVVSIDGELFLVNPPKTSNDTRSIQSNLLTAQHSSDFQDIGTCATHGFSDKDTDITRSTQTPAIAKATLQQANYIDLCSSTVDGVCLLAEIDFVFDQAFQTKYGGLAEERAEELINIVEGIYNNDLDIAFEKLSTTFLSSEVFTTSTDAETLLRDASDKKSNNNLSFSSKNEALMQVITARDFDGSTAGIAWLDGLCDTSGFLSMSTVQVVSNSIALTALVSAHELGHNLGSGHDGDGNSCGGGFIMAATLDPSATQFSTCSIGFMKNLIDRTNNQDSCFNYPYDIEISELNNSNSLIETSVSRNYRIDASTASRSITDATISGSITDGEGTFSSVTIDGSDCTLSNDSLSYSCTLPSPTNNHALVANLTATTDTYSLNHQVSVSQSQLSETDSSNNSVTDNFIVTINGVGGNPDPDPEPDPEPDPDPEPETSSDSSDRDDDDSGSKSSGGGGGGGGSLDFWLVALLLGSGYRVIARR